jgi:glycosyltransferase involved in cell wall biosynthesis
LSDEIPADMKVFRTFILDLNWIFKIFYALKLGFIATFISDQLLFPDYQKQWLFFAKRKIKKIVKKHKPELVFITSPPHSLHLLAKWIKKKWGLPVVADFRDPFSYNYQKRSPRMFDKIYRLENEVLGVSDHVIANTGLNKETIIKNFHLKEEKISIIPNGFDPADFREKPEIYIPTEKSRITITHTGYFYDNYNATFLLNELVPYISKLKERILLQFVGRLTSSDLKIIKEKKLEELVNYIPYCSHNDAVRYMLSSDYLLLILPDTKWDFWVPSKTYEYLAALKPVIAIVPEKGNCAGIITETGTGIVVDPADNKEIIQIFLNIAGGIHPPYHPNEVEIAKYNRIHQTEMLAEIFNKLV